MNKLTGCLRKPGVRALGAVALLCAYALAQPGWAQEVNFHAWRVRVTVPLNSTNSTLITNYVTITNVTSPVVFSVTGLPPGAGAVLTDTNGNPLLSASSDVELWLTVNTTNIAEGTYTFSLNGSGGATNSIRFVLQAARVWTGELETVGYWTNAANWLGGVPGAGSEVVFGDLGAQTNETFASGISFTNCVITTNVTIGSIRFAQNTNIHHTIDLGTNTLTITGTNGFSLLRDTIDDFSEGDYARTMRVNFVGGRGSRLIVSNAAANFAMLVSAQRVPMLNISNVDICILDVNRVALGDFRLYPNYWNYNVDNEYGTYPRRMACSFLMARTNIIKASYVDPDNYTNEITRQYGIVWQNDERFGVGSSVSRFLYLGSSNYIRADGVCFVGRAHATGNAGLCGFFHTNSVAVFRGLDGGRMSMFCIGDDGGTNATSTNIKGDVNFANANGYVDILADRLYMSRDTKYILSNATPNIQSSLTIGRGIVDVNTAILGFQEHDGKTNWTEIGGAQPYLNYCQADLIITNGGTVKVNRNLILGYTADTNPSSAAQQYNTRGRITINERSTLQASNILCDTGLNFYDANGRQNSITIRGGTLIVTNVIGGPAGAGPGDPAGLPLDMLAMSPVGTNDATLVLRVTAGKTNVFVRKINCTGSTPSIIKVVALSGVTSYPATIPIISYEDPTSVIFLAADVSAVGGTTTNGYIVVDSSAKTINLYLSTNPPAQLRWTGSVDNKWDLTTPNWVPVGGGSPTTFTLGDIVVFDDSSTRTNIDITEVVVPNQTTNGVTINNSSRSYKFTGAGGAIAGTAKIVKLGTGGLTFDAAATGPLTIFGGTVDGSGVLGNTTVSTGAVLNFSGTINGLTSTGSVTIASGGVVNGSVNIRDGTFVNYGTLNIDGAGTFLAINTNAVSTNFGTINLGTATSATLGSSGYEVGPGATFANFGTITAKGGRLFSRGTIFGNGEFYDLLNSGEKSGAGRLNLRSDPYAIFSPGTGPSNSIGSMLMGVRVDLHESNPGINSPKLIVDIDILGGTNDTIWADKWNNIGNIWVMNKLNGSFSSGQIFRVLRSTFDQYLPPPMRWTNFVDAPAVFPLMWPPVPGPGLQWNLTDVRTFGNVGVTNSTMIWSGAGTGTWDTNGSTGNWQGGKVYADNLGAVFDDTATTFNVNLITPVAPAGINVVTNPAAANSFFTNIPAFVPGMIVSNAVNNYTIAGPGRITGMTSLYKTGPGRLDLLTTNDFTGGLIIDGGTFAITNVNALGVPAAQSVAYNQVIVDNATVQFYGQINQNFGRAVTINPNGATFEVTSPTNMLIMNALILGPGELRKAGAGMLVLNQAGDDYMGGTVLNAGTLRLAAAAAGRGPITLGSGTVLEITNSFTFTNNISAPAGSATINLQGINTNVSGGAWSGSANVTIAATNAANMFVFNGSLTNFGGTLSLGTGQYRFNNGTNLYCTGSAAATFDLASGAKLFNLTGGDPGYDLGALSGSGVLSGREGTNATAWGSNTVYRIGAKGINTTFSGTIQNGPLGTVSVTKVGSGKLVLNGNNTFTGPMTVSAGTLGGNGSVAGNLVVESGGTLAPGASTGTFTVGGSATLSGKVVMELNRAAYPAVNDKLVVAGSITATGTLEVTNVGPTLYNGATFALFNKGVSGFSSVTLPAGYTWDNKIAENGTIRVVSGGLPPPSLTTVMGTGGALTLSWPSDYTTWQLWSNSVSLLDTNMWFLVPGSDATNVMNLTVDPSKTNVFFRLRYLP